MKLSGSRVLVTGATGGLGHAIARRLYAEGSKLVLTGRRTDVLAGLAEETGALTVAADLGGTEGIETVLAQAGGVDVLVANAALSGTGLLQTLDPELVDANLDVNLRAPILLAHALLPRLLERGRGQLVFIGSVSGIVASPGSALYNATKFGLRGFAAGLRQDLHGTGVGVSVVEPGFVSGAGMFVDSGMQLPPGVRKVTPEQVAAGVVKAITRNRGEVLVAPAEMKLGARLGNLVPELNAAIQRRAGAAEIVEKHAGSH